MPKLCPTDLAEIEVRGRIRRYVLRRSGLADGAPGLARLLAPRDNSGVVCSKNAAHTLPRSFFEKRSLVVPVVGMTQSSKTHFVAAMVYQGLLQGLLGSVAGPQMNALREWDHEHLIDAATELFERGRQASGTAKVVQGDDGALQYRRPLFVELADDVLTVFDVAGEDFGSRDKPDPSYYGPGLTRCDGLVLMLNAEDMLSGRPDIIQSYFSQFVQAARADRGLAYGSTYLDVPIVCTIGRSDLLEGVAGWSDVLERVKALDTALHSLPPGKFDDVVDLMRQADEISGDVAELLSSHPVYRPVVNGILSGFNPTGVLFLPVSATGSAASSNGVFPLPLRPFGCVTSFAWLLYRLGSTHG